MLAQSRAGSGPIPPCFVYAPGLAILLTVLAANFVGNGLRDALDSRAGA